MQGMFSCRGGSHAGEVLMQGRFSEVVSYDG